MDICVCLYVTVYAQNSSGTIHKELDKTHFSWVESVGRQVEGRCLTIYIFLYLLNFAPWKYTNYFNNNFKSHSI